MRALYLIRHGLTDANARRLYCGATDLPLSEEGRAMAIERRDVLPACALAVTSGMRRADETLWLMTGRRPDRILPGLREMDFGAFEMKAYGELKDRADYARWIAGAGECPGGEARAAFEARVRAAGAALLSARAESAVAVCHGGVIVALMRAWFPEVPRHFYQWQPGPCAGYRVDVRGGQPTGFEEV